MNKIIELKKINTIYEGEKIPVIQDINLSVDPGEFICVIGPNGAGKTTLLETINGLLSYTGGRGYVFGKEISKNKAFIRKNTGFLIQNFEIDSLAPFLCKDVVMMGLSGKTGLFRFHTKKDWEKVWYSMGLVGMIDFAKRPVGKLSGGEFQKILMARVLVQQPKILLLDEPLSNLDYSSRHQIETLLNRLHEKYNLTILMVSHDLSFIPERCNRMLVIDKGKILGDGAKKEVLESEEVQNILKKGGKT